MDRPRVLRPLFAAALAVGVAACGSSGSGGEPGSEPTSKPPRSAPALSGSITVFAAASLTTSFTQLGRDFQAAHAGTTVRFSFGASSTLAQQIIAGAPADVFASASAKNMMQVTDAGNAADPQTFANNTAEIAVAPDAAARITSLTDLAKPGSKVAVCQPQVPCGALAQQVFDKAGVTVKPVTQGLDVKSTLRAVTEGNADAAVVYVTDVRAAGASVRGVEIPAALNASTAYPIATVSGSGNPTLGDAFARYVLTAEAQAVLAKAGFAAP